MCCSLIININFCELYWLISKITLGAFAKAVGISNTKLPSFVSTGNLFTCLLNIDNFVDTFKMAALLIECSK